MVRDCWVIEIEDTGFLLRWLTENVADPRLLDYSGGSKVTIDPSLIVSEPEYYRDLLRSATKIIGVFGAITYSIEATEPDWYRIDGYELWISLIDGQIYQKVSGSLTPVPKSLYREEIPEVTATGAPGFIRRYLYG